MRASTIGLLTAAALLSIAAQGGSQPTLADSALALGRHLAQECTSCHRIDGVDNGIPSIIGLDPESFAGTLDFYRTGQRTNPAMTSVAQSLDDEQIRALALYFGSLARPESVEAAHASEAEAGDQKH